MENKFSDDIQRILDDSRKQALRHGSSTIQPSHVLMAMLEDAESRPTSLLAQVSGLDPGAMRRGLDELLYDEASTDPARDSGQLTVADITNRIVKLSVLEARMLKDQQIEPVHVLLAIFHNYDVQKMAFMKPFLTAGATYERLYQALAQESSGSTTPEAAFVAGDDDSADDSERQPESNKGGSRRPGRSGSDTPMLDKFGHDMTRAAREGRLDPVVGREVEIERLAQVLSRRKKNNPVLIGE
ncbi:MAG: ATP-dependent Clp protease ATP-binding subunit, partial [Muribaculaceae bacterium]|nr:ATP-dependent Clp protease ATP-binding subunit [Muribaculaceae bacterium]